MDEGNREELIWPEAVLDVPAGGAEDSGPAAATETRRTISVMSCRIDSTNSDAPLDPEVQRRIVGRLFENLATVAAKHGGISEPTVDDSFVALFGVPTINEDDALRAVRAASDIVGQVATDGSSTSLPVGIGVGTGEVVASGGSGDVSGPVIATAGRLAEAAAPGEVLISEPTRRLVENAVRVERVDARHDGVAWRLLELIEDAAPYARRLDAPLVGRDDELARLEQTFRQVVRGRRSHLLTILGAAGVGKSRLARELRTRVEGEALVLEGRCLPYGEGITFWPVAQVVQQAAGISDEDDAEAALAKLAELIGDEPGADLLIEGIGHATGLVEGPSTPQEIFSAVRKLFETLAARRPLVVVFDDINWGEPTFLELIEHIADWAQDVPLLLTCLARTELLDERPTWGGGKLNATTILLEPLTGDESSRLIDALLAGAELPETLLARIAKTADGNPLFIEQMLAMLAEEPDAREDIPVPPTIEALLSARLDRLAVSERAVLERGSVIGTEFYSGAVGELAPAELRSTLPAHLVSLVRKELVRPGLSDFVGEDAFRFRHVLVRDAAYRSMPKELRATLHAQFAAWIERKAGERLAEYEEIVGYHLEQAYLYEHELGGAGERGRQLARKAGEHLAAAGHRAGERGDVAAAVGLVERALNLVPEDARNRLELVLDLARLRMGVGDLPGAEAGIRHVLDAARAGGDARLAAHAALDLDLLQTVTNPAFPLEQLGRTAREAMTVFKPAGDHRGLAEAWRAVAELHLTACQWGKSAEALEHALAEAQHAGAEKEVNVTLTHLANSLYWGPTPAEEAIERCGAILELAKGSQIVEANVVSYLGGFHAMRGDSERSRELTDRGAAIFRDLGHTYGQANQTLLSGSAALLIGDVDHAESELRRGMNLLEQMGETGVFPSVVAFLAAAVYEQGRDDEALRLTEASEGAAAEDDVAVHIAWRATRAKVLARSGEHAAAEALARRAVEIAATTDFLNAHGDALLDLAEVLRHAGNRRDAAACARRAAELFRAKGNMVGQRRAEENPT